MPLVFDAVGRNAGLIHGDLGVDNVFRCSEGYKVIDWQRPVRGPQELNLLVFLNDTGVDSLNHVHAGTAALWEFLSVRWLTECKKHWIPDATSYDPIIVEAPERMKRLLDLQ